MSWMWIWQIYIFSKIKLLKVSFCSNFWKKLFEVLDINFEDFCWFVTITRLKLFCHNQIYSMNEFLTRECQCIRHFSIGSIAEILSLSRISKRWPCCHWGARKHLVNRRNICVHVLNSFDDDDHLSNCVTISKWEWELILNWLGRILAPADCFLTIGRRKVTEKVRGFAAWDSRRITRLGAVGLRTHFKTCCTKTHADPPQG